MRSKSFVLFVSLVFAGLYVCAASTRADDTDTQEILGRFKQLKDGFYQHDANVIQEIMTPNGILTTPFYSAALSVDEISNNLGVFDIKSHESHDIQVYMIDTNTALMTLYTSFKGTFNGEPLPPWVFATAVWVKEGNDWRLRNYQETAVDSPE